MYHENSAECFSLALCIAALEAVCLILRPQRRYTKIMSSGIIHFSGKRFAKRLAWTSTYRLIPTKGRLDGVKYFCFNFQLVLRPLKWPYAAGSCTN